MGIADCIDIQENFCQDFVNSDSLTVDDVIQVSMSDVQSPFRYIWFRAAISVRRRSWRATQIPEGSKPRRIRVATSDSKVTGGSAPTNQKENGS